MSIKGFDITTAATDWAAPGREVTCPVQRPGEDAAAKKFGFPLRQQMYIVVNGWTFSAVWGFGTYCTGARSAERVGDGRRPCAFSPDAEIAAWKDDGEMIELHGDRVEGWVEPASLEAAIVAAELDDEHGIRQALIRSGA